MNYLVYNALLIIFSLCALPVMFLRYCFSREYRQRIKGLGWFDYVKRTDQKGTLWLHAASVGEVVAASSVLKEWARTFDGQHIVVTVMTPAGFDMAKRILPEAHHVGYFPFDLPWLLKRVFTLIKPNVILLVETELWPNFLRYAKDKNVPVFIVNGRISQRSVHRYKKIQFFVNQLFSSIQMFFMQSSDNAENLQSLGVLKEKIIITGNTKYDQVYGQLSVLEKEHLIQEMKAFSDRLIIVAGSTHEGEEKQVLVAFKEVLKHYPKAYLLLAPRAMKRVEAVYEQSLGLGFKTIKRTKINQTQLTFEVVILDTIGELGKLYSLADIVFIGGSLVPVGGHNILEPAAHGKPIIVGPHMFNFFESYNILDEKKACVTVGNQEELTRALLHWCDCKESRLAAGLRAEMIISENQGAAKRTVEKIKQIL